MSRARLIVAVAALCLAAPGGARAAGGLDTSFGTGGKAVVPDLVLDGQRPNTQAPLLQPDGRYLVSGTHTDRYFLARLSSSLAPDAAFSGDGMVATDVTGGEDLGAGVAVQPDGKIVQVGEAGRAFGVLRFLPDGTPDTSFGGDGIAIADFGPVHASGKGVAIQPDGRIVVVGNIAGRLAIARLNADGSLDSTFSGDGLDRQPDFNVSTSVLLQPDGRILVAGTSQFSAVRYLSDGTLDPGFGGDGIVSEAVTGGGSVNQSCGIALQPDGRILLTGFSGPDFGLVRLRSNGSLDPDFSGDGRLTTDLGDIERSACTLAVQPDGRIVQAGVTNFHASAPTQHDSDFALVRYNASGSRDASFGTSGSVTTDFDDSEECCAIAFRPTDGRLVAAGSSTVGASTTRSVLARYDMFDCFGDPATRVGTNGADSLTGRIKGTSIPLPDVMLSFGGDDTISGGGAADKLCAGPGVDTVSGGAEGDSIDVRDGVADAAVSCGTGNDSVFADLQDPVPAFVLSQCESVRRFAVDDGPPGFPGGRRLRIRPGGRVAVRVRCPRRARTACRGRLTLSAAWRRGTAVARKRYRVRLGKRRAVVVKLRPAAVRRLRARGRVRARTLEQGVSEKGPRSAYRLLRIR